MNSACKHTPIGVSQFKRTHPRTAGALEGLAGTADPLRQRACCELVTLLTADGTGIVRSLVASLQTPPAEGADGAEAATAQPGAALNGRYDERAELMSRAVFQTGDAARNVVCAAALW